MKRGRHISEAPFRIDASIISYYTFCASICKFKLCKKYQKITLDK